MKKEVQEYLNLKKEEIVVDATLGLGGHCLDIAEKIGQKGRVVAFDQDERNLKEAKKRLALYSDRIDFIHDNFRHLKQRVKQLKIKEVDAVLFDLGLSSPHVDDPQRGFSFSKEGKLDMRFDPRQSLSAYDVVNHYSQEELARVLYEYGEERQSRKIARKICERRKNEPFELTTDLAEFLEQIMPKKRSKSSSKSHPATKLFQAIRIEVNDELNVLEDALDQAWEILKPGGKIVVISYHSLEDRIVKNFFKKLLKPEVSQEESIYRSYGDPLVEALTKKPVTPSEKELEENPRSRSAKLRAYKKL